MRFGAGEPADNAEREKCHPGDASKRDTRAEQQSHDHCEHGGQPRSRGCLDDGGELEKAFYRVESEKQEGIAGRTVADAARSLKIG
jgi:hypothetical protein